MDCPLQLALLFQVPIVTKLINKFGKFTKAGRNSPNPAVRWGFVLAGMLTTGIYSGILDHNYIAGAKVGFGIFTNRDELEEEITKMAEAAKAAFGIYRKLYEDARKNKQNKVKINFEDFTDIEEDFFKAAKNISIYLHEIMRTNLQWASEADYVNMKQKKKTCSSIFQNSSV